MGDRDREIGSLSVYEKYYSNRLIVKKIKFQSDKVNNLVYLIPDDVSLSPDKI